jgi:sialate O-acetylesterase
MCEDNQMCININSKIASDGMVIQRGSSIEFCGSVALSPHKTAVSNNQLIENVNNIKLSFQGREIVTQVEANGSWQLVFDKPEVGGPWDILIEFQQSIAQNQSRQNSFAEQSNKQIIRDVLVGDVFLMSGQSNMEMDINSVYHTFAGVIDSVDNKFIRQFKVPTSYDFNAPQEDVFGGRWLSAVGADKKTFGAIGFFMALKLYEREQVPIGLLQTAVPGCPIESFLNIENVREFMDPELPEICYSHELIRESQRADEAEFVSAYQRLLAGDTALDGRRVWQKCSIPIHLTSGIENSSGVIWFRREVNLPENISENELSNAVLRLGLIIDADDTYINGQHIGRSTFQFVPRRYEIPAGVLRPGRNLIESRVIYGNGVCRWWELQPYELQLASGNIDLIGEWEMSYGYKQEAFPERMVFEYLPYGVYNAMLAPLMRYGFSGLLWYQGESNTRESAGYLEKFQTLIAQIRDESGQPELPVYYVQIADYMVQKPEEAAGWKSIQEQQAQAEAVIPHSTMIVSSDVGDLTDLHPQDKKTLGERIAQKIISRQKPA